MREGIHPSYVEATVTCACGSSFKTRSTKSIIRLDICSSCHPFFTGRQKFVDSAGRVERFQKRFAKPVDAPKKAAPAKMAKGQVAALAKKKVKILSSAPIRTKPLSTTKPGPAKSKTLPAGRQAPAPAKPAH